MPKERDSSAPVVGIDLGGTNIQFGVVDAEANVIARHGKKTHADRGEDEVVDRLVKGVHEVCEEADLKLKDLAGVGIAAAGAIDIATGVVLEAPNLRWRNFPLRQRLMDALGTNVVVENDVNGAVWGEYMCGAARGRNDVLGVWVGTGVGGGLVIGGKLYNGTLQTAGECGHVIIDPHRPRGERTVEDMCSRSGMARQVLMRLPLYPDSVIHEITNGTGQITGSKQLAQAYEARDPLAVDVIETGAKLLGCAIAGWITLLALDTVVLGGGVTEALGTPYLDMVRASFERDVFPQRNKVCELRMTTLADNAGVLGAAMLARTGALR